MTAEESSLINEAIRAVEEKQERAEQITKLCGELFHIVEYSARLTRILSGKPGTWRSSRPSCCCIRHRRFTILSGKKP